MGRIHRYEGDKVIVEFEPGLCIHTGDCTRNLPDVFNTARKGHWVCPDGADAELVARICARCPTGALRCIDKQSGKWMHAPPSANSVQTVADGPLYLHARMRLNGEPLPGYRIALCRCGASRLMPFCDRSHRESGFRDPGKPSACATAAAPDAADSGETLEITVLPDGPLMLKGPFRLLDSEGRSVQHACMATICRCGASMMKPCCDGSHFSIDFHDEEPR